MYRLSIKSEFSAAHNLRGYKGKCENLHGHNWKVEAVISAQEVDKQGLVVDFHEIKIILKEILEELDHKYLNGLTYFKKNNPTSENLAKYIYDKISNHLPACPGKAKRARVAGYQLKEVTVWESDNCSAAYFRETGARLPAGRQGN